MLRISWRARAFTALALLSAAAGTLITETSNAAPAAPQPIVRLVAAQNNITMNSSGGTVFMDPGIWLASLNAPLEFRVWRTGYTKPLNVAEILHTGSGIQYRELPASIVGSMPYGLINFLQLTIRNSAGAVVGKYPMLFCPNSSGPERLTPNAPAPYPYPAECAADPFPEAQVWGIQENWAVDPTLNPLVLSLSPGTYQVTETINTSYVRMLQIPAANATASVKVTVESGSAQASSHQQSAETGAGPPRQSVPSMTHPPVAAQPVLAAMTRPPVTALPDLIAMPAWGISTSHTDADTDLLDFGATVWNAGAQLDVEGFRINGSPTMPAYQYFWLNGHVIGRAPAGTMGFASQPAFNKWHFQQFAQYSLLAASQKLVIRSHKVGFCIAPTDPVNLLLPGAIWQPSAIGLTGQCGSPTALWVQELLQTGWGDTYVQDLPDQAFDITTLPNGTYYIAVTANPMKILYERTTSNDTALREVILGGTRGNRTVKVPAWDGIDPEG